MLTIRKPHASRIDEYVKAQAPLPFTYDGVGSTRSTPPPGYVVDHTRVLLGHGQTTFEAGRRAIERWVPFELGWVEARPSNTPIRTSATLAVTIRAFGLWWTNSARIVYAVDETTDSHARFGFAYGTLPGHVEAGEERFLVEWNRTSGEVHYDIFAFSRPRHILTRLAKWQVRRMQRRFARDSAAALLRAVQGR
jgi:uncharacterized protein (UPF0548 family)